MKPAFYYDANQTKAENELRTNRFLVKKVPEELLKESEEIDNEYQELLKKGKNILSYFFYFLFMIGFILLLSTLSNMNDEGFEFNKSLPLLLVSIALIVVSVIYYVFNFIRSRKLLKSEKVLKLNERAEAFMQKRMEALGIIENNISCDIIFRQIPPKKEEINPKDICANVDLTMFSLDNKLYFADTVGLYSFDLEYLKDIEYVEEAIKFINWNKKERFNKPPYDKYKIKLVNGFLIIKGYYRLIFEQNDEKYYIEILPYDIDELKRIINR